ncbi:MAG: Nif3-like dinuclear metal center hexameric protein [Candidatus Adiutrix sp.]|nr:Nif3-like dinuclear metal center hexameric protein [Candidatus Adiutrix sp.]
MQLKDLARVIHRLAPSDLAAEWDNSGLQVGSLNMEIKKIGLALDATAETVGEALAQKCDLLLTHHPLIFKPLKNINTDQGAGALAARALAAGLAIWAAHTNWDCAASGVPQALADLLELTGRQPLEPLARDFYKLVVFLPAGYEGQVRRALCEAGAGVVGDYDRCWFAAPGEGGFNVPAGGHPFIGRTGQEARARESRLEVIIPAALAPAAARSVRASHPYQEPAFEFHPVKIYGAGQGFGLIGHWAPPRDLLAELSRVMGPIPFKWAGPRPERVSRVALLPGSGGSCLALARRSGAEVLITGDASYHQALEAASLGLTLVDLGHFETEWPGLLRLARLLADDLRGPKPEVECLVLNQGPAWRCQSPAQELG